MARSNREGSSLDIKEILGIVIRRKWLVIVPLVLVTGVAYGSCFFLTPMYRSSTIIWIDRPYNVSRELISIIGRDAAPRLSGEDRRRQLRALQNEITSQTYVFQLIRDLNLDNDPGIARKAAKMRGQNPEQSLEHLKYHLLLDQLRHQISVSFVGADQMQIAVESHDPVMARDIVTRLAEILEEEKARYELEKILDNQTFADLQLQRTEYEYGLAFDSLTAAQSRLTKLQLPENISSQENRREILSDIDKTKLEIDDYSGELESLMSRLVEFDLARARLKYTDTLVELRTEIDGQMAMFASMMEKYAWNERDVINVNIRINDNVRFLEREIRSSVNEQYASYPENQRQLLQRYFVVQENLDIMNSKVSQLQLSLDKIDEFTNHLPRLQAEIAELERKVEDARRYRDAFRSEETTVEILSDRAKDRTQYKVIEPPRIPLAPFSPNKKRIVMMGFILSLFIGGAAVLVVEMLDNSIKRVEDIEELLQLPVLATIPRIEGLPRNR